MTRVPMSLHVSEEPDGWVVLYAARPGTRAEATLVLAHGAGAGHRHPFITRYAQAIADRGLDVVTFDFPYMRNGRKAPDKAAVLERDFLEVIGRGTVPGLTKRLIIGGKSMGGRIATHLAAREDWRAAVPPLVGVVALGYPLNPPGGTSRRSPDRVSHLARIREPLLIVQGTRDSFGGPDAIRAAAPHARVLAIDTGDHSLSVLKSASRSQAEVDAYIWDAVANLAANGGI